MLSQIESAYSPMRSSFAVTLLAAAFFSPAMALSDEVIFSDGAATEGNVLLIGDKKQWDTFVAAEPIGSASGYLVVEPDHEDQAMNATWNGRGEAQFFLAHEGPRDYTGHLEGNSALVLLLKVLSPPNKKVTIRMGCGYPCAANADIKKLLKAVPKEQWIRLSFDLKCFVDGGLNIKNVDTPLLLTTKGRMALSVADVRIVAGIGGDATIRCS